MPLLVVTTRAAGVPLELPLLAPSDRDFRHAIRARALDQRPRGARRTRVLRRRLASAIPATTWYSTFLGKSARSTGVCVARQLNAGIVHKPPAPTEHQRKAIIAEMFGIRSAGKAVSWSFVDLGLRRASKSNEDSGRVEWRAGRELACARRYVANA